MEQEMQLKIILGKPPANVDFGLQKGSGNNYETILKQRSKGEDLQFEFKIKVKNNKKNISTFSGPFVHGPSGGKFIYLNIGASAGQVNSPWNRRLKIPLTGITDEMIQRLSVDPATVLKTKVAGTAKDGSPTCATVKPFEGWKIVKSNG